MTVSITLSPVSNLQNWTTAASTIDANSAAIQTAFGSAVDDTGDVITGNIDMNSNRVLNLPSPISNDEPVRLTDLSQYATGGQVVFNALPVGGTAGQALVKNSSSNYDASWTTTIPSLSFSTTHIGSDVLLNNTSNFFDGPSVNVGTTGVWLAIATVTLVDSSASGGFTAKLWDGTTTMASGFTFSNAANAQTTLTLAGLVGNPAGNIRISVRDFSSTNGKILANGSGLGQDSNITVIRIQ